MTRASRSPIGLVIVLLAAAACGGGSSSATGGRDRAPPAVALTFPTGVSLIDVPSITVRGSANDASGVSEVALNGTSATSTDDFASWEATLAVATGPRDLVADAADARGNRVIATPLAEVQVESPTLLEVDDLDFDSGKEIAWFVDSSLGALGFFDLGNGARTLVSDPFTGSGPLLTEPVSLAIDATNRVAYVVDRVTRTLFQVDLETGARTELSSGTAGSGPAFTFPGRVAFDLATRTLLVSDVIADAIFEVDPATGARTILSDASHGGGDPNFTSPAGMLIDSAADVVFVADGNSAAPALYSVALASGKRTIVSSASRGSGPALRFPVDVGPDPGGSGVIVVDESSNQLLLVSPSNGDRTLVTDGSDGQPVPFNSPLAMTWDEAHGSRLLVSIALQPEVVIVEPKDGSREFLVPPLAVGSGDPMRLLDALAFDPASRRLFVHDAASTFLEISLEDGVRTPLSGSGPFIINVTDMVQDVAHGRLIVSTFFGQLFTVSVANGDRAEFLPEDQGSGPKLPENMDTLALSADGATLFTGGIRFIGGNVEPAVVAIDVATNQRTDVVGGGVGSGPLPGRAGSLSLDPAGDRLFLLDQLEGKVYAVQFADGAREVVCDLSDTKGPPGFLARTVASSEDGAALFINAKLSLPRTGAGDPAILRVDLADGTRTVLTSTRSSPARAGPAIRFLSSPAPDGDGSLFTFDGSRDSVLLVDTRNGRRALVAR